MPEPPSLLEMLFATGDAGDVDLFSRYLHHDVVVHAPAGLSTTGLEREMESWRKARSAMPDLRHEFMDVLTSSSREAARTVVTGTLRGTYGGFTAQGRAFKIDQAVFARVRAGKISELWEIIDVASLEDQLRGGDEMLIRPETGGDADAVSEVNIAAFREHPYSAQTEHLIVEALRAAGALEVSLVAEYQGEVVGHIAFSAAGIGDAAAGWFLLGPVAVRPARQGEGIGRALVEAGLRELRSRGASGCVLVGDPAFYGRFGFRADPGVTWPGVPPENVLCLLLAGEMPRGEVTYHPAFLAGM